MNKRATAHVQAIIRSLEKEMARLDEWLRPHEIAKEQYDKAITALVKQLHHARALLGEPESEASEEEDKGVVPDATGSSGKEAVTTAEQDWKQYAEEQEEAAETPQGGVTGAIAAADPAAGNAETPPGGEAPLAAPGRETGVWPVTAFAMLGDLGKWVYQHHNIGMMAIVRAAGKRRVEEVSIEEAKAAVERILARR